MPTATELSATQQAVVAYLQQHGGRLTRWPGGFWTTPDTLLPGGRRIDAVWGYDYYRHGAPVWSTTVQTVRALEKRGVLVREHVYAQEWADTRRLTAAYGGPA